MGSKELVEEALRFAAKGDAESLAKFVADDAVIHVSGNSRLAGEYKGKEGFFTFFGSLRKLTDDTLQIEPHAVMGDGGHAVALLTLTATRDGKTATWNQANVYHIVNDVATDVWILPQDQIAYDQFWGK